MKWAAIGRCSSDVALHDIQGLLERRVLLTSGAGGRRPHDALTPPASDREDQR